MDGGEQARTMAFDWTYSLLNDDYERADKIADNVILLGPERISGFLDILSIIFSSFSSIIKKEDEEKHRRICASMKNPPQKLLDAHREYRNGGTA